MIYFPTFTKVSVQNQMGTQKSEELRKMNLNRYSFTILVPLNFAVIINNYLENIISIGFISIPGANS